jgi:hypothetical protein
MIEIVHAEECHGFLAAGGRIEIRRTANCLNVSVQLAEDQEWSHLQAKRQV